MTDLLDSQEHQIPITKEDNQSRSPSKKRRAIDIQQKRDHSLHNLNKAEQYFDLNAPISTNF